MTATSSEPVSCVCIDMRKGIISTSGGTKPVFIMELYAEAIKKSVIKYFNCESKTKGCYTVKHNSDFAKLYRVTLGENPTSRFSKAGQLLNHFLESRFVAEYENAIGKKGVPYLKVNRIIPEVPVQNDGWTPNGTLKKCRRKAKKHSENGGDYKATLRRQSDENKAKHRQYLGDDKTLQPPETLDLEPVFNPIKPRPAQGKTTYPLDHTIEHNFFLNLPIAARAFYSNHLDVLLNNFEFEQIEAEEFAREATVKEFGETN